MVTDAWTEPATDASPYALSITHFMEVVAAQIQPPGSSWDNMLYWRHKE
ncbi:hypothetical protein LEMLEM_LOCUS20788 [Lemmus lemmus]